MRSLSRRSMRLRNTKPTQTAFLKFVRLPNFSLISVVNVIYIKVCIETRSQARKRTNVFAAMLKESQNEVELKTFLKQSKSAVLY